MALVMFEDGPLAGQEKDVADTNTLASEYPGYSATEQVLDPQRGQVIKTQWNGDEAAEASYPESKQEDERRGNETGVRDREAQRTAQAQEQQGRETRSRTDASRESDTKKK